MNFVPDLFCINLPGKFSQAGYNSLNSLHSFLSPREWLQQQGGGIAHGGEQVEEDGDGVSAPRVVLFRATAACDPLAVPTSPDDVFADAGKQLRVEGVRGFASSGRG